MALAAVCCARPERLAAATLEHIRVLE